MSEYPEVDAVGRLMDLAARYGLEELEVEEGGLKVRLEAARSPEFGGDESSEGPDRYVLWRPPVSLAPAAAPATATPAGRSETAYPLSAPLGGIFYRSPATDAPPFVEVGDLIEEGQTIGLIEAMKVFSEIPAERAGRVVELVAVNGRLVRHSDVLLYLEPVS